MKSTGIVRKVDEVGRFVLPIETRRILGLEEKSEIEIFVENDTVVLKKYHSSCMFCQNTNDLTTLRGKNICKNCIEELK